MTYRIIAVIFAAGLLTGCSTTPDDTSPLRLRVLSYNIHHGEGNDGKFDYQRLADVIKRADPDLVALQEVDRKTGRSKGVDQAATLAKLTGMHDYFARAMHYDGGEYGEALLSRRPYRQTSNLKLPAASDQEPRAAAMAVLRPFEDTDLNLWLIGTHLCHQSAKTRLEQCRAINAAWELSSRSFPNNPTILAGDFNFTPGSEPYKLLIAEGWVDTAASFGNPRPTCPADQPTMRIDYVFVRPADRWRVIDVKVLDEPVASDHAPLLVELEYVEPRDKK